MNRLTDIYNDMSTSMKIITVVSIIFCSSVLFFILKVLISAILEYIELRKVRKLLKPNEAEVKLAKELFSKNGNSHNFFELFFKEFKESFEEYDSTIAHCYPVFGEALIKELRRIIVTETIYVDENDARMKVEEKLNVEEHNNVLETKDLKILSADQNVIKKIEKVKLPLYENETVIKGENDIKINQLEKRHIMDVVPETKINVETKIEDVNKDKEIDEYEKILKPIKIEKLIINISNNDKAGVENENNNLKSYNEPLQVDNESKNAKNMNDETNKNVLKNNKAKSKDIEHDYQDDKTDKSEAIENKEQIYKEQEGKLNETNKNVIEKNHDEDNNKKSRKAKDHDDKEKKEINEGIENNNEKTIKTNKNENSNEEDQVDKGNKIDIKTNDNLSINVKDKKIEEDLKEGQKDVSLINDVNVANKEIEKQKSMCLVLKEKNFLLIKYLLENELPKNIYFYKIVKIFLIKLILNSEFDYEFFDSLVIQFPKIKNYKDDLLSNLFIVRDYERRMCQLEYGSITRKAFKKAK